jgi:hypothetical protein
MISSLANHDRLDQLLPADQYTAPECGSMNAATGKPHYCSFECPTLVEDIKGEA